MEMVVYKGYSISPNPQKHQDGSWQVNFHIMQKSNPNVSGKSIKLPIRFNKREETVRWCYPAGREFIEHYVSVLST